MTTFNVACCCATKVALVAWYPEYAHLNGELTLSDIKLVPGTCKCSMMNCCVHIHMLLSHFVLLMLEPIFTAGLLSFALCCAEPTENSVGMNHIKRVCAKQLLAWHCHAQHSTYSKRVEKGIDGEEE